MGIVYFQYTSFYLFYNKNLINNSPSVTTSTCFYYPKFKDFVQQNPDVISAIFNYIIVPLYPVPEASYLSCSGMFDELFGIPLKDINCFTYVRSPRPSEILTLYGLPYLIPSYPCIISTAQIRILLLHVLPLQFSHHIAKIFLFKALLSAIPPPTHIQCIGNCFTLQPLHVKHNRGEVYQQDPETTLSIYHLSINARLDQSTILKFPAVYRTSIARNKI